LLKHLPKHGLGTLDVPKDDSSSGYAASVLFFFGLYWGFPWLIAAFYIRSSNYVARSAAVLSLLAACLYCAAWLAWWLTTGDWRFLFFT